MSMAKAMTGSFYLTETVRCTAAAADGSRFQGTIDLGAYVNVPTGQAIAIESVDFIYQNGTSHDGSVDGMLAGNGAITVQLVDLNPGTVFIRADNHSLVASGSLNIDVANCIASHTNDLYPDNFGAAAQSESFMVVSDSMFLVAGNDGAAIGSATVDVTARIRCRVVKLGSKDWMALAIQSTASES